MELINEIVEARNFWEAWVSVKRNHGAAGIDNMPTEELDVYLPKHMDEIVSSICDKKYKPSPVRRVYIPKPNGKQRPLGIPTVVDRVVQQAAAHVLSRVYEPVFSDYSYEWKKCGTIYKNLLTLKRIVKSNLDDTSIYQAAMTILGWYRQCGMSVFNFLLSPKVLAMPKENRTDKRKSRPGLVDPYALYQNLRTPICM